MKHLLNGVAIAAALAIVTPVWAQTSAPMTPSAPSAPRAPAATAPAAPAPSAAAPMKPMASKKRAKRATRHMARHGKSPRRAVASSGDNMTNQLNREELARIQSGGSSAPAGRNQYGQPMQTQGMPGANQSSPSSHPAMPAGR